MGPTHDVERRLSPEYRRGQLAFQSGKSLDDCPYGRGDRRRTIWMTGFIEERVEARVGPILRRNGLSWP